jgi:hypothetical protein
MYHGLARRHLSPSRFLMRPLLNGGTLAGLSTSASGTAMGFLERLSKFFSGASSTPEDAHAEEVHEQPSSLVVAAERTLDTALASIQSSGASPQAVEAFWDGDTEGWFVILSAACIVPFGDELDLDLGVFRHGGDTRLFNGQAPPWSEAASAQSLGEAVSARLGIPFYFPSPVHPEERLPAMARATSRSSVWEVRDPPAAGRKLSVARRLLPVSSASRARSSHCGRRGRLTSR